jgi:hypothetical protein
MNLMRRRGPDLPDRIGEDLEPVRERLRSPGALAAYAERDPPDFSRFS